QDRAALHAEAATGRLRRRAGDREVRGDRAPLPGGVPQALLLPREERGSPAQVLRRAGLSGLRFEPYRELGRTGFAATRIGVGDLADRAVAFETLVATLRRALDFGLNLVDTAPSYEDGHSERVVGAALAGRRSNVFVIDKVDHLDRPVADQVGQSLERLGMEAADAFVLHGVR